MTDKISKTLPYGSNAPDLYIESPEFVARCLALIVLKNGGKLKLTHGEIRLTDDLIIGHTIDRSDPDPEKWTLEFYTRQEG